MGYVSGDHLVICDMCGFKYYRSECRFNYRNLLVCEKCWEPRHPQEKAGRPLEGRQLVKDIRQEGTGYDTFIEPGDITKDDL